MSATIKNGNNLSAIKCVHETHVIRFIKLLAASFRCEGNAKVFYLHHVNIPPTESTALFQFLNHIKNLQMLEIVSSTIDHLAIREFAKFTQEWQLQTYGVGNKSQ